MDVCIIDNELYRHESFGYKIIHKAKKHDAYNYRTLGDISFKRNYWARSLVEWNCCAIRRKSKIKQFYSGSLTQSKSNAPKLFS